MRTIDLDPDYDRLDAVRRLQFAADGRSFAAIVGSRAFATAVSFWDLVSDREAHKEYVASGDRGAYALPAVAPDLSRIAYETYQESTDVSNVVVETVGGGPSATVGGDDEDYIVYGFGFTPGGETLLAGVGGVDGSRVSRWDVAELLRGGRQAATTAADESIEFGGPALDSLATSADGSVLAVGFASGRIAVLNPANNKVHRVVPAPPARKQRAAAPRRLLFAPSGGRLAVRANGAVTVWDVSPSGTGRPLVTLSGPQPVTDAGWSPDGRTLATASADGSVTFWAADGFAEQARFDWGVGPLAAVAFAPDGLTCAAGGRRGRVVLWDVDG